MMLSKFNPIIIMAVASLSLSACENSSSKPTETPSAIVSSKDETRPPNVIIFYADDLGYGDLGRYGAVGVKTPEIDALAAGGMVFTDAHASAATCTPSRYSLLTGEYGFRAKAEIIPGDAPLQIRPGKTTLASKLKEAGYVTGVVGKWHLGLGDGFVDWNKPIKPGPLEIGFDYSFLLPATGDRVPTVYVENHDVIGLEADDPITVSYKAEKIGKRPTGVEQPDGRKQWADRQHSDTIVNGISRIGFMAGGYNAEWVDEDFPDVFTGKALDFIRDNKDKPFFLFHSYHDIHVPRIPHPRFVGTSQMGPRGDAIVQMDWMTGQIVKELEQLDIAEDTILIFTSDNGPVLDDGYSDEAVEKLGAHKPWGPFRGGKYSAYEAGARMPTIVSWPGRVKPGESDALISQVDFLASIASLADAPLSNTEAIDSLDLSAVLLGESKTGRDYMFKESVGTRSMRFNDYKYIRPMKEGAKIPAWLPPKGIEGGLSPTAQLFDLESDIGETRNLADQMPDMVEQLEAKLVHIENRERAER